MIEFLTLIALIALTASAFKRSASDFIDLDETADFLESIEV